ncbi:hypothetical protein [Nocardiopsis sp. NPDC057823]|uniref:hypothetical protein n=1 Tax=Nocardiopsis sp. NPDC057823 TaxID=3346256 RepID=UPI00366D2EF2
MTTHLCEGPCNRAWRRARDEHAYALEAFKGALADWEGAAPATRGDRPDPPAAPTIAPVPGDPVWCPRCTGAIRAALADLDNLAALLAATADGHRGQGDDRDRVTASAEAPSPSPIADVLDQLYGYLSTIEGQWRQARDYGSRPARSRGAGALTTVIAWLGRHLDDILADPGSTGFGTSVLKWQRLLQRMTKTQPERRRRAAPCPRCDRRTLIYEEDRGLVRCENPDCGRVMTPAEYDAHADTLGARP